MSYFLFRFNGDHYRMEKATTVQEACFQAFGMVYRGGSGVQFKNIGGRHPRYVPQKVQRASWYNDEGWQNNAITSASNPGRGQLPPSLPSQENASENRQQNYPSSLPCQGNYPPDTRGAGNNSS